MEKLQETPRPETLNGQVKGATCYVKPTPGNEALSLNTRIEALAEMIEEALKPSWWQVSYLEVQAYF